MGQGIAQVAAMGGITVKLNDARPGGAAAACESIAKRLKRLAEKGRIEADAADEMAGRIGVCDSIAEMSDCHCVIEAVFEDLDLKRKLFAEIEDAVNDACVIASNTSSILIASIARESRLKNRIAGLHFFNPVPLMALVEVVRGPDTDEATLEFLTALGTRMGRTPVTVKDAPGFLVNLGGRAYTTEAMRIVHERAATPAEIDAVMRDACGFRMGPCELMDLTGVDVNYPVSMLVYEGYNDDPRLKTSLPHRLLLESGRLGRKTGQGNYRYGEGAAMIDPESPDLETSAAPAKTVVLIEPGDELRAFAAEIGVEALDTDDGKSPLLAAPLGEDCSSLAARLSLDHTRLVGVDLFCNLDKRITLMSAPGADPAMRDGMAAAIAGTGRKVTAIKDSPGFIAQRMQAMVANLGCEMAQTGIAEPDQVDLAMRLGLNYPRGPLELAEHLGTKTTLSILERMQAITGDDRYRPSAWLRRRAQLGLSCHTPD